MCASVARGSLSLRVIGALAIAFLALAAGRLGAQTVAGTILGNVLDSSGAAVPDSEITITNQDTGVVRIAASTADGVYNVPSVLPGKYTVEAKARGFSPAQVKDVVVNVGSDTRVDLKLQVGSTTQAVTVTESIPTVETTSSEVSQVMDEDLIKDIPLNARDLQQLAVIQPGVQWNFYSSFPGKYLSVLGDRVSHNRFLQEGMDTNWTYKISPTSLSGILLGVEATKEFKVLTTDFGAEYGEVSGGTVNTLFKSGTNQLHGSAYEYYRNAVFDAKNAFDVTPGAPPFQRHQFGGALGGPIRKDKTFFFVNYEGFRSSLSLSDVGTLPDSGARAGTLPCNVLAAGTAGCNGSNPDTYVPVPTSAAIQQLFFQGTPSFPALMPACNGGEVLSNGHATGICAYNTNPVQVIDEHYGLVKINQSFGSKNTLSASYNIDQSTLFAPAFNPVNADDQYFRRQTFTVQDTQIISSNVVNTVRFGVNRVYFSYFLDNEAPINPAVFVNPNPVFTPSPFPQMPGISIVGITGVGLNAQGGGSYAPRWIGYTSGILNDDFNYLHGKHAFQFGVQDKKWDDNTEILNNPSRGTYSYSNLQQFLSGAAQTFTWSTQNGSTFGNFQGASDFGRSLRFNLIALYAEDTYKIKSNLTLTYGLRWEYVPGPKEARGRISTINNPNPETSSGAVAGGPYYTTSAHDFAPRLGFNWDPFKKGTTSVRGGGGIFYNQIEEDSFYYTEPPQPPFVKNVTVNNVMTFPFSPSILTSQLAGGLKLNYTGWMPPNPKTPYKVGYNLTVQQELPDHMSLMIGYVGAQSRHLGRMITFQDYYPTTSITPGQVPMLNGVPIAGAVTNPFCTAAGEITCLYWAGSGVKNSSPTFVNPNFGAGVSGAIFDANAFYNSLQTALERRMSPGLYARLNYTFARCITDASDDLGGGETNGGSSGEVVDRSHSSSRGRCSFQGTHSVNLTLTYDLPFGRNLKSGFEKQAFDGWQLTSQTAVTSGTPFDVRDGANVSRYAASGTGLDRPNWAPGCNAQNAINKDNTANYINASCFQPAPFGYLGDVGALSLTGPGLWDTDVSLKKAFPFKQEGRVLQLGADMFNAFNRTNLADPSTLTVFSSVSGTTTPSPILNPTAGKITTTLTTSRQFQISARFAF